MLDLRWLSEHLDEARKRTALRGADVDFDRLGDLIERRRTLIGDAEAARYEQRQAQEKMKSLDKRGEAFAALRDELRALSERAKALDQERKEVVEELDAQLLEIPNLVHESVPVGQTEEDNAVVRVVGDMPTFDFEVRDHQDLGEALGLVDMERARKVTGSRFAFLRGAVARLNRVLIDFMLELHTTEHGYTEVVPPFLVNADSMTGTGQLPKFADEAFRTDDYFLIPTAEVPVTNYFRDEILEPGALPVKLVAYSPCFRREAGSYGKDTRGLIRQHQFEKVELVQFVEPERSYEAHEALTGHAERVLQLLGLAYRVVSLSTGDISFSAAKCHDLEVWLPSQGRYREISSCSNFEAFQARRANIRYRGEEGGKPDYVHTLNGSGLAIGRTLLAIMENYQQADGSIRVPEILVERMGAEVIGPPPV